MASDLRLVLQVVHITDLHVVAPGAKTFASQHRLLMRYLPRNLRRFVESRSAPHDGAALRKFGEFLLAMARNDPSWRSVPTWLVDTGDLTGYGDAGSLALGDWWLQRFGFGDALTSRSLFGNHDAWPGRFPLFAKDEEIEQQLQTLRARFFPHYLPQAPLRAKLSEDAEIQLWGLNSIAHERMWNTFAYGLLRADPELNPKEGAVAELIALYRSPPNSFRILATHHPLHYPPPAPKLQMVLNNAQFAADEVARKGAPDFVPAVHLILSGHTHELYPPMGSLPEDATLCRNEPLQAPVCQLVGGTLSQQSSNGERWPQQFQILRFYHSSDAPREILMERIIAGRELGSGDFEIIEHEKSGTGEEILFRF